MRRVTWDEELAQVAQDYSDQCIFQLGFKIKNSISHLIYDIFESFWLIIDYNDEIYSSLRARKFSKIFSFSHKWSLIRKKWIRW